jgi:DNA replication and repair protein RecF
VRSAILNLRLTDFRSYARAELSPAGRSVFLFGPNGAGKTNLLEAISLLSPGRGLRGAPLSEVGRREPAEAEAAPWAVSVTLVGADGDEVRIGTGVESGGSARRLVRIDGQSAPPGELARRVRPMWLTPAQDRLFLDGAIERRRFLDRLVFAAEPLHAAHVGAYERALRERTRLLTEEVLDPGWVKAVEARLAAAGAQVVRARAEAVRALTGEIAGRPGPFPKARLELTGEWERAAFAGETPEAIETRMAAMFAASRDRDRAAGRALSGPHRGDLAAFHLEKRRPAAECSTGEQKALIFNLVLAQAGRLSRVESQPSPILLLDEVAAHLDPDRRAALFDEIEALSLQAFLTGTDAALFETLKGRAIGIHVDASRLTVLED